MLRQARQESADRGYSDGVLCSFLKVSIYGNSASRIGNIDRDELAVPLKKVEKKVATTNRKNDALMAGLTQGPILSGEGICRGCPWERIQALPSDVKTM